MAQSVRQLPDPIVESIAGLSAGLASTLIAHPLDLIKTRLQGIVDSNLALTYSC